MGVFLALSVFLGIAFVAAFVGFAALCVGAGDPVSEDFDRGDLP
jgi:hypothetical protein